MNAGRITWAALAATTVSFGLNFSAGVFFAPASTLYGVSITALTVAATLSTLLTGLVQPYVGTLLDRVGARGVLVAGLVLMSASYLALSVVSGAWQFIAAYAVLGGLGFASSSSLTVSTLIGRAHGNRAGPALTRAAVGINLGQLIAPWAATALFGPVGIRGAYAVLGAAGLAVTAVLAVVLPADRPPARKAARGESLRGRGRVVVSFGLHAATMYTVVLMLPKHAAELGWSVVDAGRLVAVVAVAAGLSSMTVTRVLRRHRPEVPLLALHVLRTVSLLLAAVVTDPWQLLVAAAVFGASSFPVIPLTMAVLSRGLDPTRMGRTLAPAWVVHQLSAAAGLAAAALVHVVTDGYRGYFVLGVALSLTASVLAARGGDRETEADHHQPARAADRR